MSVVTIHEAKTHLSRLIRRALDGEEIVIARRDEPLVRLEVLKRPGEERRFGALGHLVVEMDETFDEELADFAEYGPGDRRVAEDDGQ